MQDQELVITASKGNFQLVTFTWNEELNETSVTSIDTTDDEIDELIANKVHEGNDFDEWVVSVNL